MSGTLRNRAQCTIFPDLRFLMPSLSHPYVIGGQGRRECPRNGSCCDRSVWVLRLFRGTPCVCRSRSGCDRHRQHGPAVLDPLPLPVNIPVNPVGALEKGRPVVSTGNALCVHSRAVMSFDMRLKRLLKRGYDTVLFWLNGAGSVVMSDMLVHLHGIVNLRRLVVTPDETRYFAWSEHAPSFSSLSLSASSPIPIGHNVRK